MRRPAMTDVRAPSRPPLQITTAIPCFKAHVDAETWTYGNFNPKIATILLTLLKSILLSTASLRFQHETLRRSGHFRYWHSGNRNAEAGNRRTRAGRSWPRPHPTLARGDQPSPLQTKVLPDCHCRWQWCPKTPRSICRRGYKWKDQSKNE